MTAVIIRGGRRLNGEITVSGAKNASLPLMAASILSAGPSVLENVPPLTDVLVMKKIMTSLGVAIEGKRGEDSGSETLEIRPGALETGEIPAELMRRMRSSIFLMGPLLARRGRVVVSRPGGCEIGPRPVDLHLQGLQAMGVRLTERSGFIVADAGEGLKGSDITLDYPSVGATENLMMAAVLAEGTTVVRNAAREPEIVDLERLLRKMGALIRGAGSGTITVRGVERLDGCLHRVIPDRIEAGTFAAAVALCGGDVTISGVRPRHLKAVTGVLRRAGAVIETTGDRIRVLQEGRPKPVRIRTMPYPGFPTDLQNQLLAVACFARGTSVIVESVFQDRFRVVDELRRMGAEIETRGRTAVVDGVAQLSGAEVRAVEDLRGSASLILAGLGAAAATRVDAVDSLDRGYVDFERKLRSLGADIHRQTPESARPAAQPVESP